MPWLDDHRRLYGALFLLGGAWSLRAAGLDSTGGRLTLVVGVALVAAGAGLLLRRRWARALGVGVLLPMVVHLLLRRWLVGDGLDAWRIVATLAGLWGVIDLARTDVTEGEELARRERDEAARRLAAGRLRAKLAHLREHLEAVEEQVREAHAAEGHLEAFEDCAEDDCAQLRAHLAETWAKLDGADPSSA